MNFNLLKNYLTYTFRFTTRYHYKDIFKFYTITQIKNIPKINQNYSSKFKGSSQPILFTIAGIWSFFRKDDEEETPEQKLIMTIKRSILCIQREQYDKAEQMLHLALRMAQDLQHKDGITYVYDVMANLAMEREQFEKAEKLFVDVMKRLFADGHTEDSSKVF